MKVYRNVPLKEFNTFGINAKARRLVVVEDYDDLNLSPFSDRHASFIIGAGSDVIFTRDYEGMVIMLDAHSKVMVDGNKVRAWAGMRMDDLVQWSLANGLYGLENLSAIPGTVGAAAVQNVGAYGVEAKDFIVSVETVTLATSQRHVYNNAQCRFGYRTSRFKEPHSEQEIIAWVTFALSDTFVPNLTYKALEGLPHATAQELRDSIVTLRWQKLPRPEEHGSAGSFFKNPVVDEATYLRLRADHPDMPGAHPLTTYHLPLTTEYKLSAGWLIDKAGWKGRTMGRVGVWPNNALVLYNLGGCTGDEVVTLAQAIQEDVRRKFGVALEPEAIII